MILPFHPTHLDGLDPVEGPLPPDRAEIAETYSLLGPTFTLEHQGRILACGGVVLTSATEGRAWAVVSKEAVKFPLTLTRNARFVLDSLRRSGLETVFAEIGLDFTAGRRWAEILGFRSIERTGRNFIFRR
jgi:hypothetical protein